MVKRLTFTQRKLASSAEIVASISVSNTFIALLSSFAFLLAISHARWLKIMLGDKFHLITKIGEASDQNKDEPPLSYRKVTCDSAVMLLGRPIVHWLFHSRPVGTRTVVTTHHPRSTL